MLLLQLEQFVLDDLHQLARVGEQVFEVGPGRRSLDDLRYSSSIFSGLEAGQALELQVEDGLRLALASGLKRSASGAPRGRRRVVRLCG